MDYFWCSRSITLCVSIYTFAFIHVWKINFQLNYLFIENMECITHTLHIVSEHILCNNFLILFKIIYFHINTIANYSGWVCLADTSALAATRLTKKKNRLTDLRGMINGHHVFQNGFRSSYFYKIFKSLSLLLLLLFLLSFFYPSTILSSFYWLLLYFFSFAYYIQPRSILYGVTLLMTRFDKEGGKKRNI